MKLDQFVSETLKQIIDGVFVAQQHATTKGAQINPVSASFTAGNITQIYDTNTGALLERVEFDVHVQATQESTIKGTESVGEVTVASGVQSGEQNTSSNRIKFTVPVLLPTAGDVDRY